MDQKTINFIKVSSIILSAFLVVLTLGFIKDMIFGKQIETYPSSVTITAVGEVKSIPNIATFQFGVSEKAATVVEAQNKMNEKANKAIAYIKSKGIEEKDIQTTGYNAYPTYDYVGGKQVSTGFQTSESVVVKVRDTTKAGEVLGGVAPFGVTDISGLTFTTDDKDALKKQATEDGVNKAKQKAADLAKAVGFKLGKVTGFYEENSSMPISAYADSFPMAKSGVSSSPELQPGQETITSTVSITYEIR